MGRGDPGALLLIPSAFGDPGFESKLAADAEDTGIVTSAGGEISEGAAEPTNKLYIIAQPVRPLLPPLPLPPLRSAGLSPWPAT